MSSPPARPKIYHITHIENLQKIVNEGGLLCDREMLHRGGPSETIGISDIKKRRIEELEVSCHPGTKVGDYVPFFFCPRSLMLYVIHRANHRDLAYRDGQGPIIHLEADLHEVIQWADAENLRWAFSLSNAGAYYAEFRSQIDDLDQLDWAAIGATDFRSAQVKEGKQAEFLLYERFSLHLVERIGVQSTAVRTRVARALVGAAHRPPINVRSRWYF